MITQQVSEARLSGMAVCFDHRRVVYVMLYQIYPQLSVAN